MTTSRSDRIRLATGVELHYVESGDPAADETLLFLHGWPDSSFSFSRMWPRLSRHRCLAIDQRGFGDSERPDGGYRIEDLAEDAVAFLDALGVGRATLVGHSMGSFVARRVAERHPDRVARLVLIGTALRADNDAVRQAADQVAGLSDPISDDFVRHFHAAITMKQPPVEFFWGIVAEGIKAPVRVWRAVLNGLVAFDDTEDLPRLPHPTMVLGGRLDPFFSREEHQAFADAVPKVRVEMSSLIGHCMHWEHPALAAAYVGSFLDVAPFLQRA